MSSTGPGPRDYTAATERALYAFSGTTCYFPDCDEPVIRMVEGEPYCNVQIAHIHGAIEGSERYDAAMTNDDRRDFGNLVLLCKPHHELVDKRHPEHYPADVLLEWKSQRESAAGIDRKPLAGMTEDGLIEAILKAVAAAPMKREATVELGLGLATRPGGFLSFPVETAKDYLYLDMYKDVGTPVLTLTVQNTGGLKVYVNRESVHFNPSGAGLLGAPLFRFNNPSMPRALEGGESDLWFYDLSTVTYSVSAVRHSGGAVETLVGRIGLGSGEEFESTPMPAAYLPD